MDGWDVADEEVVVVDDDEGWEKGSSKVDEEEVMEIQESGSSMSCRDVDVDGPWSVGSMAKSSRLRFIWWWRCCWCW